MLQFSVDDTPRCKFCGKPATKLCDFPVGRSRYVGHPPRTEMEKAKQSDIAFHTVKMRETLTCDAPICDDCAVMMSSDIDFCPACVAKVMRTAKD